PALVLDFSLAMVAHALRVLGPPDQRPLDPLARFPPGCRISELGNVVRRLGPHVSIVTFGTSREVRTASSGFQGARDVADAGDPGSAGHQRPLMADGLANAGPRGGSLEAACRPLGAVSLAASADWAHECVADKESYENVIKRVLIRSRLLAQDALGRL